MSHNTTWREVARTGLVQWLAHHKQPLPWVRAQFVALDRFEWDAVLVACGLDDFGNIVADPQPLPKHLFEKLNETRGHVKAWRYSKKRVQWPRLRERFMRLDSREWNELLVEMKIDERAELAKIEPPLPGIITRAMNYAKAKALHVINGSPVCTEEQVSRRFAICRTCDQFRVSDSKCAACGCAVTRAKIYDSKLRWADSECPHPNGPKWPAEWKPLPVIQQQA